MSKEQTIEISLHVNDLSTGAPAEGLNVKFLGLLCDDWVGASASQLENPLPTDDSGRIAEFASGETLQPGIYKLELDVGGYFEAKGVETIFRHVPVEFRVDKPAKYHIVVCIAPGGYHVNRGS